MAKSKSKTEAGKNAAATLREEVTQSIIEMLEKGVRPWARSWKTDSGALIPFQLPVRHNRQHYQGINILILWAAAEKAGYKQPMWMTYQQAQELGGQVRNGEKSTKVCYSSKIKKDEPGPNGEDQFVFFTKVYSVFNIEQIDKLSEEYFTKIAPPMPVIVDEKPKMNRNPDVDAFFDHVGANITYGGEQALYSPSRDAIAMPNFDDFYSPEDFYSTLIHEHVHWTGAQTRLGREFGPFGSATYAAEELVAELGAAFLCAELGITSTVREDHASYIASWIEVLKNDKRAIFDAASKAQKAVTFLHEQSKPAKIAKAA